MPRPRSPTSVVARAFVAELGGHERRAPPRGGDLGDHGVAARLVAAGHHDGRALGGERGAIARPMPDVEPVTSAFSPRVARRRRYPPARFPRSDARFAPRSGANSRRDRGFDDRPGRANGSRRGGVSAPRRPSASRAGCARTARTRAVAVGAVQPSDQMRPSSIPPSLIIGSIVKVIPGLDQRVGVRIEEVRHRRARCGTSRRRRAPRTSAPR